MLDWIREAIPVETLTENAIAAAPQAAAAVGIMIAFWILNRAMQPALRRALAAAAIQPTLTRLLVDNIFRSLMLTLGLLMALSQLGVNVTAALAGLGIAGLAIGFAAQDSVSNVIAGFLIFWDKPFLVGDYVTVVGQYGRVHDITLRTTRIRTNQNMIVVIPNKNIIDDVLVNHSKNGETRIDVPMGIAYKEDIPRAREVILEAVSSLDWVLDEPAPDVVVVELGDSSVNLMARPWISDAASEPKTFSSVLEVSKIALDRAGIEIPFPHLQLFVDDVRDRVWNGAATLAGRDRSN